MGPPYGNGVRPVDIGSAAHAGDRGAVSVARWAALVLLIGAGLALLYRFVPGSRRESRWRSVTWGVGLAMPALVVVSAGLSVFVTSFGRFNQTYGAVAAVAVLMLWLYLSTLIVLLGAEVNGAIERHMEELSG